MADIRINALPNTATDFASDDYIAVDGTTNGTRKLNAKSANLTLGDVVLGTNGPSVKSSLDARAARQGLLFDGATGSYGSFTLPALGTGDFTVSMWIKRNSGFATYQGFLGTNSSDVFALYASSSGVYIDFGNGTTYQASILPYLSAQSVVGKTEHWTFTVTRSGNILAYLNGILTDTIPVTLSTSVSIPSAAAGLWSFWAGQGPSGSCSGPLIYNRALSASEVVSLFEAGVPSGADYNSASNTSINTSACIDGNYGAGFTGASATGFTASAASGSKFALAQPYSAVSPNQRFRVSGTLTLNAGKTVIPTVDIAGSSYVSLASGAFSVELVSTVYSAGTAVVFRTTGDANYTISGLSITRLGLLLAPDAGQVGGGTTWYDTSGNAANITLPASGVSWNVPTSGKLATSLTIGGTGTGLTLSPSSGAATLAINGAASGSAINYQLSGTNKYTAEYVSASDFFAIGRSGVAYDLALKNGNTLLGKVIDNTNGILQLATHTTSAGGIGFGADTSWYRTAQGSLALDGGTTSATFRGYNGATQLGYLQFASTYGELNQVSGTLYLKSNNNIALTLDSSQNATFAGSVTGTIATFTRTGADGTLTVSRGSGASGVFGAGTSNAYLGTSTNHSLVLYTNNVTALTVDSSQRTILSGALRLNNAYTASVIVPTGYVTIQDSTGTTYKVAVSL